MNGPQNHWLTRFIQTADSFRTSQLAVVMNGPLNHWLTRFIQTADSFRNESIGCPYDGPLNHWLTRFIQTADSFRNESIGCPYEWATESLTHSIHSNGWFVQKRVNWLSLWMGHWVIDSLDSFKRLIRSETSQLAVLMNGPQNHWLTRFIQTADSFRNESIGCPYESATESLTHSIHSNGWFVQKRVNWLSLWMGHRIIDSLDSFKRLIC